MVTKAWERFCPREPVQIESSSAFFSCQLSAVERKYDIGNRKLLAVKLALEEWHHWLEGAKFPFLV